MVNILLQKSTYEVEFCACYICVNNKEQIRGSIYMKEKIHPKYAKTQISCACGNLIETASTEENMKVEICNNCHPFFTGTQKIMDTEGRVERFKKRYANTKKK